MTRTQSGLTRSLNQPPTRPLERYAPFNGIARRSSYNRAEELVTWLRQHVHDYSHGDVGRAHLGAHDR